MRKKPIIFLILFNLFVLLKIIAYEDVLIDFNNLQDTTIDFSKYAGDFWTEEQRKEMILNLQPQHWLAKINKSSWTNEAKERTYIIPVTNSLQYPNQTLLGIRAYFPERKANSYLIVKPPFSIPSFYDNPNKITGEGDMFLYKGVIRNVGIIRKISVRLLGNNFKYAFYVRVKNHKGIERDIFIDFINFIGWRSPAWVNPHYEYELKVRDQQKNERPYYPDEYPYIKFEAFIIHRAEPEVTGNFVTMIKSVSVDYDKQFLEVGKEEYLQEQTFGIYHEQLVERSKQEMKGVDERIYLEWLERKKQDHSDENY